ncbi:Guanylate cyclase [Seminavis robusta]|uniref:Guanylate cyclase n=1 Tax=Seminavis robusta TaxID=568900 RepID=A0A9N8DXA1_9STRA|nr:Guanylate cyclase [Seminavis robusta]|eukprot:Sro438_g143070.1 Guanylate cyclase (646) ;mRNA; r:39347-41864
MTSILHLRYLLLALLSASIIVCGDVNVNQETIQTENANVDASEETGTGEKKAEQDEPTCKNPDSDGTCLPPSNLEECGIWLAPSSIPGAGLGMYAGRDFKKGEELQPSGEIVIPMIDINHHQYALGDQFFMLWDEYTWSATGLHMDHLGYVEVKVASPGFGSAANSFIDLVNVDELRPRHSIPHGLHRSRDPGAGAFSTYHDRQSTASVDIQKGEELFVDYGQQVSLNRYGWWWFRDRKHFGPVPLLGDLDTATSVFKRFLEMRQKHHKLRDEPFGDLWVSFVEKTDFDDSRSLAAFRKTEEEWRLLHQLKTLKEIRILEGLRTDEWLREHGTCADNMVEGESTIRQAGRGAFATRRLVKDSVIAPLPLIHIGDASILDMLEFEDIRTLKTENVTNGAQLTLNYCFGHRESSLLLCPYGPLTSLINHNQTQANVKLRWADAAKGNHEPELLERLVEHFAFDKTAKLAMELIALRDIQPGEEIFLDYGDDWEAAWQQHVQSWEPHPRAADYISAYQLDSSSERLLTEFEQMDRPYPENVQLRCDIKFFRSIDYDHFQQTGEITVLDYHTSEWVPCEILRFRVVNNQMRYTAVARVDENKNEKLTDAPKEAFKFLDNPYTTDMFLPNAFRHAMMIPDEMFPEYWMNL